MKSMNCKIDDHIIRLLQISGFGTYQALKEFTQEDLDFIVAFVKSGDILDRIESSELPLFLGCCKTMEKFSLVPGERKLIFKIVAYVQKNHTESEKSLGKMSLYPMFKAKPTRKLSSRATPPSSKKSKTDFVNSCDMPKEILDIKKLLKDRCKKKSLPRVFLESVPNLNIVIKTVDTNEKSYLSAVITCSICKNPQSVQRNINETWNLSNMNRHWGKHIEREDYKSVSIDSFLSGPSKKTVASSTSEFRDQTNSDQEDNPDEIHIDLTGADTSEKVVTEKVNVSDSDPGVVTNSPDLTSETQKKTFF